MSDHNLPADVIKYLKEYEGNPPLKDDELTADRAAAFWDCPYDTARGRLKRMVKQGIVTKEYRNSPTKTGSTTVTVYIFKKENK